MRTTCRDNLACARDNVCDCRSATTDATAVSQSSAARLHLVVVWRQGVTLIELLAVLVVIMLFTAIAMRTVVPTLENRKMREGTRMVTTMLNAARNRALETGRPAGVWFERLSGIPEACTTLYYADVPEPYSGDYPDSMIEAFIFPDPATTNAQYYVNVVRPVSGGQHNRDIWSSASPNQQQLIRPGDMLQVNFQRTLFRLESTSTTRLASAFPTPAWVIGVGANATSRDNADKGVFTNRTWPGGRYIINWWMNDTTVKTGQPVISAGSQSVATAGGAVSGRPVPYQIMRQPVRSAAGAMQLPDGLAIDLNYSGPDSNQENFHPRTASLVSWSTTSSAFVGAPAFPNDTTPVIIMFSPTGSLDRVYRRLRNPVNQNWEWGHERTSVGIMLHIGKLEKIPASMSYESTAENNREQLKNNWLDPDNNWVLITPMSGYINSGEQDMNALGTGTLSGGTAGVATNIDNVRSRVRGRSVMQGY